MSAVGNWFSTRWAALHWIFRVALSVLVVVYTVAFLAAIIPGDWMSMLSAVGGFVLVGIIADWQYWEKRGRVSQPLADFGYLVARDIHRAQELGEHEVTIRMDGNQWVIVSYG